MVEFVSRQRKDRESARAGPADAAGLYVHVPFCRSKCRYCGFYSVPTAGRDTGRLVGALLRELEQYDGADFCTGYVGGGSPTAVPAEQLVELARSVAQRLASGGEFTVECNPGQVELGLLEGLRRAGVNRLSFGAQSFRAADLELLGRRHGVEDIGRSVVLARQTGFDNLGLDLIFAIPGSTLANWQYNVEAALDLGVPHISAYGLSFEPGTVLEAWRQKGRLDPVEEELDRAMYDWVIERLGQAGLDQYEISNFARPGYECRHNLGYWANRPYVGIGPGAASNSTGILPVRGSPNVLFRVWGPSSMGVPPMSAGSSHVQACPFGRLRAGSERSRRDACSTHGRDGRATSWAGRPCYGRMTHDPDIERYVAAIESGGEIPGEVQPVSWEDALCETAVLGLRMRSGIDLAAFARRTGCDPIQTFAEPIRRYGDLGLIEVADGSIRLTARALPVADTILCDFAALG